MNSLVSLEAQLSRLRAERDGSDLQFSQDLLQQVDFDPVVSLSLDGERRAFLARSETREGKKKQLNEQISQLQKEIDGLAAQALSTREQFDIAKQELSDLEPLGKKGLTPRQRITSLQKEVSRSKGLVADLEAKIAEAHGKIAEIRLQILQLDSDVATEAATGIRDLETKIGELKEKRVAAENFLRHIDIKAPIAGRVQQLAVHTIGGVIASAEQVMLIVPDTAHLIVEAQISPLDVDQVAVGQETLIRFLAFNQRTTPELVGHVFRVAADAAKDQQTNQPYFTVGIAITGDEISKLGKFRLVPGMPAEIYIKTGERTFASYILKPLTDQFYKSMRED
jgi:HlyD family secretion protein